MKPSSFQKKVKSSEIVIPGCLPSLYTHHLLTSTGIPDLDDLLGGGLPVGSLLLIEEDWAGSYAKLVLKYFLAEGVYHRHSLHLTSLLQDPSAMLQNLPSFTAADEDEEIKQSKDSSSSSEDKLKIAWRYQNIGAGSEGSKTSSKRSHSFNLLKAVESERLAECDIVACDLEEQDGSNQPKSVQLLRKLQKYCEEKGFLVDKQNKTGKKNILRIGVQSLGDILWQETEQQVLTFLLALKSLLRNCFGVALITLPPNLHENQDLRDKLESCGDIVVRLSSFDSEWSVNPAYKDYHGILSVERISCLGVLTPPLHLVCSNNEMVFKSRRNKFLIESFHLPPDLSEVASRDSKDPKLKKKIPDF